MHVEPGACFVAGGLWHPAADALGKLRASIDDRPIRWGRILSEERFRAAFLPTALPGDPAAAKRAFADRNKEGALKKGPLVSSTTIYAPPLAVSQGSAAKGGGAWGGRGRKGGLADGWIVCRAGISTIRTLSCSSFATLPFLRRFPTRS